MNIFKVLVIGTVLMIGTSLFAQDANKDESLGVSANLSDTGSVQITNILIEAFEDAGSWQGLMPRDLGIIRVQAREGGPKDVIEKDKENNKYCLGAKVSFFKTGYSHFSLQPPREIQIKGVSKSLSIWVAGRNFTHKLRAIIRDFNGELRFTSFGRLNFYGWQQLHAQIPMSIVQENYKLFSVDRPRGIKFCSFVIDCAPDETVGDYFMYIDNLEAKTDIFWDNPSNLDSFDMKDTW